MTSMVSQIEAAIPAPIRSGDRRERLWLAGAIALACAIGIGLVLYATSLGVMIQDDSGTYLELARNVRDGQGLVEISPDGQRSPLVVFPPLYPLALAAGSIVRADPVEWSRYLNCVALACLIAIAGRIIWQQTRSRAAVALGLALLLTSRPVLGMYTRMLSETLFVPLTIAALWLIVGHGSAGGKGRWRLILAALLMAAAALTRYAGIVLVPLALAAILSARQRTWRARIIDAVLLLLIVGVAMETWALRSQSQNRPLGGRSIMWHPPEISKVYGGLAATSAWISASEMPGGRIVGIAFTLACLAVPLVRRRRRGPCPLLGWLAIFVVAYVVFLLVSMTFFDALIPLNTRLLMPIYPPLLVLATAGALLIWDEVRASRWRAATALALLVLIAPVIVNAAGTAHWAQARHRKGQGYLSAAWRESEIIAEVRKVPEATPICSNAPDAIYVLTGRRVYWLPTTQSRKRAQKNQRLGAAVAQMAQRLGPGGIIVYLAEVDRSDFIASPGDLSGYLKLIKIKEVSDGQMYRIEQRNQ
jgi:hypothetical protein